MVVNFEINPFSTSCISKHFRTFDSANGYDDDADDEVLMQLALLAESRNTETRMKRTEI